MTFDGGDCIEHVDGVTRAAISAAGNPFRLIVPAVVNPENNIPGARQPLPLELGEGVKEPVRRQL